MSYDTRPIISSPRSPRSHRSHRSHDTHAGSVQSAVHPSTPGPSRFARSPSAQHREDIGDVFGVNPDTSYQSYGGGEAGAEFTPPPAGSHGIRNFVGGWKRLISGNRPQAHAESELSYSDTPRQMPEPVLNQAIPPTSPIAASVHSVHHRFPYRATAPSVHSPSVHPPPPSATNGFEGYPAHPRTPAPLTGSVRSRPLDVVQTPVIPAQHAYPDNALYNPAIYHTPAVTAVPVDAPTSTIGHGQTLEGTTAVGHEPHIHLNPGSPVHDSPNLRPASDYAKMDPPPEGEFTFKGFLGNIGNFFRELNELPWVADRITTDFVPGEPVHRLNPSHRPHSGRARKSRPPSTWYGVEPLDLTRDVESPHNQNLMTERRMYPNGGYIYAEPTHDTARYPYPIDQRQAPSRSVLG